MKRKPHMKVYLAAMPPKHGGRCSPIFSGYRGQFYYDGKDCDGSLLIDAEKVVGPEESVDAFYQFCRPEVHLEAMFVGKPFLLREGNRAVAYGAVIELCDDTAGEIECTY